jgi:hypothetical protein
MEKEMLEELSPQKNSFRRIHHSKHHNVKLSEKRTVDSAYDDQSGVLFPKCRYL